MPISKRLRDAIIQSLRAGVVPRVGLHLIQVGRKSEVEAMMKDLDKICDRGSTVKFVIGRFGAGKSFFLNLVRTLAIEKNLVVVSADITPDKRLHGGDGQARKLYSDLIHSMGVRGKTSRGAFAAVIEGWLSSIDEQNRKNNGDTATFQKLTFDALEPLQSYVSGSDFNKILLKYWEGFDQNSETTMNNALRWLRAEYTTRTDARKDLGIRTIIDDSNVYDYIKLISKFVQIAGYAGLLVNIDEMGVISHRVSNSRTRDMNYEVVLKILNDCLQGQVEGLGFIFAGVTEFLEDRRRGMASYDALATRLASNEFAVEGLRDFHGPVLRLPNLTQEDLYVLLHNLRRLFSNEDESKYRITDKGLKSFMEYCNRKLGATFYLTPRESIKSFVGLLSVLDQNKDATWESILKDDSLQSDSETGNKDEISDGDSLQKIEF